MSRTSKAKSAPPTRLIPYFSSDDEQSMTNFLTIAARDIEDALLQCGAKPGKDYTHLDLIKLAVHLASARADADKR